MNSQEAKTLLQKYRAGNCTDEEIELIETWYSQLVGKGDFFWEEGERDVQEKDLKNRIMAQIDKSANKKGRGVFSITPSTWWAAASVIFLAGIASYFLYFNQPTSTPQISKITNEDIKAPLSNKAVITLSNGQKILLDSSGKSQLTLQGNAELVRLPGGKIVYKKSKGNTSGELQYNTLSNPKGSKVVNIVLADGSRVWLNAGSSLTYPVLFVGSKRDVSIDGEAYFDIARDPSKPFVVKNGNMEVQVLGTQFNVNTFKDDDNSTKVTLLEGAVDVFKGTINGRLKPGQQAIINSNIQVVNDVDISKVMAWKNGYFQFDNASLQSVLRQISRWYDVEVIYEGKNRTRGFVGEMERDLSLSEILKILEMNKVQFKVIGKKLIIKED